MSKYTYHAIQSDEDADSSTLAVETKQQGRWHPSTSALVVIGIVCILAITLHICPPYYASTIPLLSATLGKAIPFKIVSHPEPPTSLWGNVVKPYPTGAFWTNFVIRNGDYAVAVLPYGVKCIEAGIQVSYGPWRRVVSQLYVQDVFAADVQISAYQAYQSRGVEGYDSLSVGMAYKTALLGKYKGVFVKGAPFITVVFENATPVITTTIARIVSAEFRPSRANPGVQYLVTLSNNQKWLVYCSETIPLTVKDNSLTSPYPIRGFVRVAFLPPQNVDAAFSTLMTYVQRYPIGAVVSLAFPAPGNLAQLTYQFASVGTGPLLMLSLAHQSAVMVSPSDSDESRRAQGALTPVWCIKGRMRPVVGELWRMQYALPQVLITTPSSSSSHSYIYVPSNIRNVHMWG